MKKVFLVYVFIAEICDSCLHEVCASMEATNNSMAELLKDGYKQEDINIREEPLRNF